jgi:hypothetical protein
MLPDFNAANRIDNIVIKPSSKEKVEQQLSSKKDKALIVQST